jgi:transposase-like protein
VALAEKHEKPVSRIAADSGINRNMPRRRTGQAKEATGSELPPFPGHGKPRDEELTRLRKENKVLRMLLKKAAVIFTQGELG